nr:MAG TPA_asm: hypothetical protein [Caudoviricetes sp.]
MDLNEAENSLAKQKTSLMQLTKEIKSLEHKQVVMRRQRDVYAGLLALSVSAVIARR